MELEGVAGRPDRVGIDQHFAGDGQIGQARGQVDHGPVVVTVPGDDVSEADPAPRLDAGARGGGELEGDGAAGPAVGGHEHHFVADVFDDTALVGGGHLEGPPLELADQFEQ